MNQKKNSPFIPFFIFILLMSLWKCEPKKATESNDDTIHNTSFKFFILLNKQLRSILEDIEYERKYNEEFESRKAIFKATDSVFVFDSDSLLIELKPSKRRKLNNYLTAQESEFRKILSGIDSVDNYLTVGMKTIEEYYLNRDQSIAHRNDTNLFLRLKNGTFKELKNKGEGNASQRFLYQGFLKEIGYYFIVIFPYEGVSYCLYNQSTGKGLFINGILNPSPKGQYWAGTSYNIGSHYNSTNLNLWIKGKEKLLLLFEWKNPKETPWKTEWIDEQTLLIETLVYPNNLPYDETLWQYHIKERKEIPQNSVKFYELKIIQKKK